MPVASLCRTEKIAPTCDRKASKAPLLLQCFGLSYRGVRREYDRVEDETVLKTLHFSYHFGLIFCRAIMVDNA